MSKSKQHMEMPSREEQIRELNERHQKFISDCKKIKDMLDERTRMIDSFLKTQDEIRKCQKTVEKNLDVIIDDATDFLESEGIGTADLLF
jgi:myosin heavy subunit